MRLMTYCAVVFAAAVLNPELTSAADWQAGFSKVVITPEQPMFASGYGSRNKPSDGQVNELHARAAALRDPSGKTVVFLSTDLIGVPVKMAKILCDHAERKHGLRRADVMITCSHTHCGPALDHTLSHMLDMKEKDWEQVRSYQKKLNAKLIALIDRAMDDLSPARLATGSGVSRFAANRRNPKGLGPYDHAVPVLRISSAFTKIVSVVAIANCGYNGNNKTSSTPLSTNSCNPFLMVMLPYRIANATGTSVCFWILL